MGAWGAEMHEKIFFLKKGMTCHTSMDVWKDIEKKNKFLKHCFKWGTLISKCMCLYQNAFNGGMGAKMHSEIYFWKKGMTCHTSMDVCKDIEKKNKFLKHCFKWGVLISKWMYPYQNECTHIKMHAWRYGEQNALGNLFLKKRQHFSHIHGCL